MKQVNKISIIGAGHIGESCAFLLAIKQQSKEIVMVDIIDNLPQGKAADMLQSAPLLGFDTNISGSNDFADIKDSDIIIMTAGYPRKAGMTLNDTITQNAPIMQDISEKIVEFAPDSIIIIVSYPLEAMAYVCKKVTNFPYQRIIGQAGLLDTARFISFVAKEKGISNNDITAITIGSYEEDSIPLIRFSLTSGEATDQIFNKEQIDKIIYQTKKSGSNISKLLGTNAYIAPAAATVSIAEAIIQDKKSIVPCYVSLNGEYGYKDIFLSVPARLSRNGVEEIIELDLISEEKIELEKAVKKIRKICSEVDKLGLF